MNEAELLALRTGLREADKMGFRKFIAERDSLCAIRWAFDKMGFTKFIAEGDSLCAIRWASGSSNPLWRLVDLCDNVAVLASKLEVTFTHIKRSRNGVADVLAKMGVGGDNLVIDNCITLAM